MQQLWCPSFTPISSSVSSLIFIAILCSLFSQICLCVHMSLFCHASTVSFSLITGTDVLTRYVCVCLRHGHCEPTLLHNPGRNLHSNGILPVDMEKERKDKFANVLLFFYFADSLKLIFRFSSLVESSLTNQVRELELLYKSKFTSSFKSLIVLYVHLLYNKS